MGIHKYGLDTSSSQLGIKSLGTRESRVDGHGFRSCIVVLRVLCLTCCVICVVICVNNIHGGLYMEH